MALSWNHMISDCEKHAILHVQFKHSRATKHDTSARFSAHDAPNTIPVQFRALAEYQTLRLCKFELSRATKHYIYAGLSAHEPPNITPVHVWTLANHQTLHLCMFQRSRSTKHYTCAGFAHGEGSRSAKHYTCAGFGARRQTALTSLETQSPFWIAPSSFKPISMIYNFFMIFDALSDGIYAVSPTCREPLKHRHDFAKIMKKCQKSMFTEMTQENLRDV